MHPLLSNSTIRSMLIVDTGRKDRLVFWGPGAERQMADAASANIRDAMRRHPSLGQAQVSNVEGVLCVRDNPGRFLLRCQAISSEANDAIWGCLLSHGIGLDQASSAESPLENEVVVVTDLADRARHRASARYVGARRHRMHVCGEGLRVRGSGAA